MRKTSYFVLVLLVVFSLVTYTANAKAKKFQLRGNAGFQLIMDSDVSDVYDDGLTFGVDAGFMVTKQWEITGGVSLFSSTYEFLGQDFSDLSETHILVGSFWHFGASKKVDIKIGGGVDFGSANIEVLGVEDSESDIGFWAAAGLDFTVAKGVFVGGMVRYIFLDLGSTFGGLQILGVVGVSL